MNMGNSTDHEVHNKTLHHVTKHPEYKCDGTRSHEENFTSYGLKFMPLFNESRWPLELRAFLYIVCLLYIFVGIKYAVDAFMDAVKYITSRKIRLTRAGKDGATEEYEVKIWNETVATLTLGALATASPEILLNIIELASSRFTENDLGPSSIVGSAAFNLFITTAVAMVSVPTPAMRKIHHVSVYFVALSFSIIAYFWLLIVIIIIPPIFQIETYQAAILLALFPIMIICAYLVEKRPGCRPQQASAIASPAASRRPSQNGKGLDANMKYATLEEIAMRELHLETPEDIGEFVANRVNEDGPKDIAYYRKHDRVIPADDAPEPHHFAAINESQRIEESLPELEVSTVQFAKAEFHIREKKERVFLRVIRYGYMRKSCNIHYETAEGTATPGQDYVAKQGTIHFSHGTTSRTIEIEIMENKLPEADEIFYVQLWCDDGSCKVGTPSKARIRILGDVVGTLIEFKTLRQIVVESEQEVTVVVARKGVISGKSEVFYKTKDGSGLAQVDYVETSGMLVFAQNQTEATIKVPLLQTNQLKKHVEFFVRLRDTDQHDRINMDETSGVQLGSLMVHTITVVGSEEQMKILLQAEELAEQIVHGTNLNWREAWREQFVYYLNVNYGDLKHARPFDYVKHMIGFAWKVIFAFVPPNQILGGWLRFFVTLCLVGAMVATMGDVAMQIGCLCGINEIMVGLTLVTIGANLPDVFATRHAAINAKEADEAIGHIWGAICVNAMVGLGLPWFIGCIYFLVVNPQEYLHVSSTNLVFPFAFFLSAAVLCAVILMLRRYLAFFGKGELGGTPLKKYTCGAVMVACWCVFIGVSHLMTSEYAGREE